MSSLSEPARPIFIVTGANNGVGFGICRRLLYSLAQEAPDDARPLFPRAGADELGITYPCTGATLVMACRSRQRAEAARAELLALLEKDTREMRRTSAGAQRVEEFLAGLTIAIHSLDLASVRSTLAFADEVARTYPYVSALVCNAGVAPFLGMALPRLLRQLWRNVCERNLFDFVTYPKYNIQDVGVLSDDGLGWAWQCNVFGHYVLCRALEERLAGARTGPGRVLWMSSLEAFADAYDADDWQLVRSARPYEGTKFQADLLAAVLAQRAGPAQRVRYFSVHPGVVGSSIDVMLVGRWMSYLKIFAFYIARWFGSLHHNVSWWNGAASAVYVCLAPLAFIPVFVSATGTPIAQDSAQTNTAGAVPARLHSITDRRGRSSVALDPFDTWPDYEKEGARLADRCEKLYRSFVVAEGKAQT
ncbi:3-keto sterol reductase [Gloeopeniophorella convolvens]|nr:3-keto sterol reductase [Gloeopeniophorella convolvens]